MQREFVLKISCAEIRNNFHLYLTQLRVCSSVSAFFPRFKHVAFQSVHILLDLQMGLTGPFR